MATPRVSAAGGLAALLYVFRKGRETGLLRLYRRLRSKNTCKTCALGMGGQLGGMVNEAGHFPEICKKSVQAQAGDMSGSIGENYFARTPIAQMKGLSPLQLESLGRLTFPVIAEPGATHFRKITWVEAISRAADEFKKSRPEEVFFYSSGRSSNEAAFLMQLVARAWGTSNVHNCSYYCHQASGVALNKVYGSGTSSVDLEDLQKADLAFVTGANPASNHPRLITQLVNMRSRGGKVIVVNPLRELGLIRFRVPSLWRSMITGSAVSDLYLQPHIGGDVALYKALLKGIVEAGALDSHFLESAAAGWPEVLADVEAASWDSLIAASGVPRGAIDKAVRLLASAERGIFLWAMGLTHHVNGVDNILALANLAMSRGWLGREGAGLLPIRGHSNVQGVGSMGVGPDMKEAFARKMEELYGIKAAAGGQDTYSSMKAADEGRIRAAFLLGGNLFGSNPDRSWSGAALRKIPLTVYVTTKLNEGHVHGGGKTTLLLPALARDEESQGTTQESMFNYVRLSEGGNPSVEGEMRSEVEIIASLAERILPPGRFDWSEMRSHENLRRQIAAVIPGFEALSSIEKAGGEFQIGGRTFHEPVFKTPDGKAHFFVTPVPAAPVKGEFRLMTIRSEGQFNTVVYEEEDLYRGNATRDVVMMSAEDAHALGVGEGELVVVESEAGKMTVKTAIAEIRSGNLAMYYPEANALVPQKLDPQSKTPAFKCVDVKLTPLRSYRAVAGGRG